MSSSKSPAVDMFTNDFVRYFEVAGSLIQAQQKQLESAIPKPPPLPVPFGQPANQPVVAAAKVPGEQQQPQPRIATLVHDLKAKLAQLEHELHRSPKGQELKRQMDFALAKFASPDLTIALEALKSLNAIFNRDDEIVWTFWPYLHGKSDQLVLLCAKQFRLFLTAHYTPEKFTGTDGTGRRQLFNLIQHNTELLLHMILSPTKIGRQISRESFHELLQTLLPYLVIHESSDKKYLFQAITSLLNTLLSVQYDPKTGKNYFPFDHTKLVVVLVRLIRDFHQALFAKPGSPIVHKYIDELEKLLATSLANIKLKWSRDGQRIHSYMNLDLVMYEFYNFYEFYSKTTSLDWNYHALDTMRSYLDFIFIAEQDDIWDYTSLINKELTISKRAHKSSLLVLYMKNHATPSPHHLVPSKTKSEAAKESAKESVAKESTKESTKESAKESVAKESTKELAKEPPAKIAPPPPPPPPPPQAAMIELAKVNAQVAQLSAIHSCPSNDPEVRFAFIQAQFDAARREYGKMYCNMRTPEYPMMKMIGQMGGIGQIGQLGQMGQIGQMHFAKQPTYQGRQMMQPLASGTIVPSMSMMPSMQSMQPVMQPMPMVPSMPAMPIMPMNAMPGKPPAAAHAMALRPAPAVPAAVSPSASPFTLPSTTAASKPVGAAAPAVAMSEMPNVLNAIHGKPNAVVIKISQADPVSTLAWDQGVAAASAAVMKTFSIEPKVTVAHMPGETTQTESKATVAAAAAVGETSLPAPKMVKPEDQQPANAATEDDIESLDMEVITLEDCCIKKRNKSTNDKHHHQMDGGGGDSDSSSSTTSTSSSSSSEYSTSASSSRLSSAESSFEVIDTDFNDSELAAAADEQSSFVEVMTAEAANSPEPASAPKMPNQAELFQCVQGLHADLLKSQDMICKLVERLTDNKKKN